MRQPISSIWQQRDSQSLIARDRHRRARSRRNMRGDGEGVAVIAQATLANGRWFGRSDVLRRVERPSRFGDWSYEVYDCKLARETKAATVLQLSLYSELLATIQGVLPEWMYVVPPVEAFKPEPYRILDFAATIGTSRRDWKRPLNWMRVARQRIRNRIPIAQSAAGG